MLSGLSLLFITFPSTFFKFWQKLLSSDLNYLKPSAANLLKRALGLMIKFSGLTASRLILQIWDFRGSCIPV